MPIHENLKPANAKGYNLFNAAVDLLGVADANILNVTTVKGTHSTTSLEGMIRAKTPHQNLTDLERQIADAMANLGDLSLLTDAGVAAANTVAGMRSIFTTNDSSLSGTNYPTFGFPV